MTRHISNIILFVSLLFSIPNINHMGLFDFFKQDKPFNLDKILSQENETKTLIDIDMYLNKKSNYGEHIEVLTEPQQVFLFIENLEREVNNGGFNQFYTNGSGEFSLETVEALKVIGALKTVEIVKRANAQFPEGKVPKDWRKRDDLVDKIESVADPIWHECDEAFYKYEDSIGTLLLKYVHSHKDSFKN